MTATTKDTADDICAMLMQGYTPDYLHDWEENGLRIDPAAIEKGFEMAIKKLRQEAERALPRPLRSNASSVTAGLVWCSEDG